jgi:hypothetical protein
MAKPDGTRQSQVHGETTGQEAQNVADNRREEGVWWSQAETKPPNIKPIKIISLIILPLPAV